MELAESCHEHYQARYPVRAGLRSLSRSFLDDCGCESDEEARNAVIGMTESWEVLFVVHLERDGDAIRLISARRVTAKERNQYENGE